MEINEVDHDAALAAIAPLFEHELERELENDCVVEESPAAPASAPAAVPAPAVPQSGPWIGRRGTALLLSGFGVMLLGGGGWWVTDTFKSEDLARTVASIPPARHVKPAWLDDQVPTINATLIGVPSAATPAGSSPDTSR